MKRLIGNDLDKRHESVGKTLDQIEDLDFGTTGDEYLVAWDVVDAAAGDYDVDWENPSNIERIENE